MAIDLKRCVGCHTCSVACKMANNLPNEIWWNRILTVGGEAMDTAAGTFPNNTLEYLPVNCQHCDNPACVKACPVGATYKRKEDGLVIQDYDKCIGCRYCMVACPYSGVRQFNWKKPDYYVDFAIGDANITPINTIPYPNAPSVFIDWLKGKDRPAWSYASVEPATLGTLMIRKVK